MRIVFSGYHFSEDIHSADEWLQRIALYRPALECLAKEHEVIRVENVNFSGEKKHNGIQYYFLRRKKSKTGFLSVNKFIKKLQPDIVVIHGLHYPLQTLLLHFSLNKKTKLVIQNHAEKTFSGIKKIFQRLLSRYTDAYFFASKDAGLQWVTNGNITDAKKIHEVMEVSSSFYPIKKEKAIAKTNITGVPAFLWVGRLNENKDPLTVIKAFTKFIQKYPFAKLYMIFSSEELLNEIHALGADATSSGNIQLIGKLPHEDLLYWYNSFDFFVAASYYEGSGTAVCEAMSCGCIPILSNISSFKMMTQNGSLGLLYETGNETELLNCFLKTLHNDVPTEKQKVLERFKNKLSFEAIARDMNNVFKQLAIES